MRILVLIIVLYVPSVLAADAEDSMAFSDDSVYTVARSSLSAFLDKIPQGYESRYGFLNRKEFTRASPGVPIRVYIPEAGSVNGLSDSLSNHPRALNEWRVPILVDGEHRALLTVEAIGGKLAVTDLGAAGLSRELGEFKKKYPARHSALFRLQPLQCDFIIIDRTGVGLNDGDYHPMRSARTIFSTDAPSPRSRKELFAEIRRLYHQRSATHSPQE
jgi:hypothetical protein